MQESSGYSRQLSPSTPSLQSVATEPLLYLLIDDQRQSIRQRRRRHHANTLSTFQHLETALESTFGQKAGAIPSGVGVEQRGSTAVGDNSNSVEYADLPVARDGCRRAQHHSVPRWHSATFLRRRLALEIRGKLRNGMPNSFGNAGDCFARAGQPPARPTEVAGDGGIAAESPTSWRGGRLPNRALPFHLLLYYYLPGVRVINVPLVLPTTRPSRSLVPKSKMW